MGQADDPMKRSTDPRVKKLARFLQPHGTHCPCWSCGRPGAEEYATKLIRTIEASGLRVTDPNAT